MNLLRAHGLSKDFGGFKAVKSVNFSLHSGQIMGVMGPNGAGKTTLLKLFSGHLLPTSGQILFRNDEITNLSTRNICNKGISYLSQRPSLFPSLTVEENLRGSAQVSSIFSPGETKVKVNELLELTGLVDRSKVIANELSYGEMRVLDLGMCLATQPALLLADEPTAGVDEGSAGKIINLLKLLTGNTYSGRFGLSGLIFVEHVEGTLFDLADQLCFINRGEIKSVGQPDLIRENSEVKEYLNEHKLE
ncbi:ATP-binding cassette domain-containing protein [Candidatus Bipolaricaulota bacterium]|nr:ATP-binding cassette domain-containing protein [Candidatus Bipolaricaulota bacterium]MBS3814463.1 ATP-binding cassette domain-containing protein [Candidatus Bipolaricaulota bacterium]MBS3826022.1 ATP-binding cassette domain-containing protein [Candidatus Bipolaricaulota bacterium]